MVGDRQSGGDTGERRFDPVIEWASAQALNASGIFEHQFPGLGGIQQQS